LSELGSHSEAHPLLQSAGITHVPCLVQVIIKSLLSFLNEHLTSAQL